jgi:hypothetical protein
MTSYDYRLQYAGTELPTAGCARRLGSLISRRAQLAVRALIVGLPRGGGDGLVGSGVLAWTRADLGK